MTNFPAIDSNVLSTICGGARPLCTPEQAYLVGLKANRYASAGSWAGAIGGMVGGAFTPAGPVLGIPGMFLGALAGHQIGKQRGEVEYDCRVG